jgi:hypothetical protein
MSFKHKENTGSLFPNDKKINNQPDYTGVVNIGNKDLRIAAWIKEGTKGNFLSIQLSEFEKPTQ